VSAHPRPEELLTNLDVAAPRTARTSTASEECFGRRHKLVLANDASQSNQEILVANLEHESIWSQSLAIKAQSVWLRLGARQSHGQQIRYTDEELVQFHFRHVLPRCLEVPRLAASNDSLRPLDDLARLELKSTP
jgi:hypothetical protein